MWTACRLFPVSLTFRVLVPAILGILALAGGSGCTGEREQAAADDAGGRGEVASIVIGQLPYVDYLPFLVAEEEGLFEAAGVEVRIEPFKSALERDSAYEAGAIDGGVGDVIAAAQLIQGGVPVRILSLSLGSTPAEGVYTILASPRSSLSDPVELAGVPIGISLNSSIEYVTDLLLAAQGIPPDQREKQAVNEIPLRFQMLMAGQIEAATLPEPLANLAELQGARRLLDDSRGTNLSQSVLLFTERAITAKRESLHRMFQAYREAVERINASPESYRGLLEKRLSLPPGLQSYAVPRFPSPQLPREEDVERVLDWMRAKGLLQSPLTYHRLVLPDFLGEEASAGRSEGKEQG